MNIVWIGVQVHIPACWQTFKKMKLKTGSTILTILLTCTICLSQEKFDISKSENSELILVLNNLELLEQKKTEWNQITLFKVANPSGSANYDNSEVTHVIYVAITEYDEEPRHNLFKIGSFYNPKFLKWIQNDYGDVFVIEYGEYNHRKSLKIGVDLFELGIIK